MVDCLVLTGAEESSCSTALRSLSEATQAATQDHNPVEMEPNELSEAEQISAALLRVPEAPEQ